MIEECQMTDVQRGTIGPVAPTTVGQYLRNLGPGLLVAMSWLGAGDLVSSAVSGGNYGYGLMWALALALICRYFFTAAIARYALCNVVGDRSVLEGFGALWRHLPATIGVLAFLSGFILQTFLAVTAGTALFHLSGGLGGQRWGVFGWTVLVVAITAVMLVRREHYRTLEIIARVKVGVLVLTFVTAAALSRPDAGEVVRGLAFGLPPDQGPFGTLLVAAAIIGVVGGSAGNLMYPEFIRNKGWSGPGFMRIAYLDLLLGVVAVIIVNLSIWIVGAQVLHARGGTVKTLPDLAAMMGTAIGAIGPWLLWVGLFFVAFCSFSAYASGYTQILFRGMHRSATVRAAQYPEPKADPLFKRVQIGVMVLVPVVFALPVFPEALSMTVIGSATAGLLAPVLMIGTIVLTNDRRRMAAGYTNRWWTNLLLCGVGLVGLWASYSTVRGLLELAA
jgi:Mn2+/Fe2+ NRAMP family transporter